MLGQKESDGSTLKHHLMQIERKTGTKHELLSGRKPLMKEAMYLWQWWLEMRADQGTAAVNARAMQDWQWLTGNTLNMAERRIIQALEAEWRRPID